MAYVRPPTVGGDQIVVRGASVSGSLEHMTIDFRVDRLKVGAFDARYKATQLWVPGEAGREC